MAITAAALLLVAVAVGWAVWANGRITTARADRWAAQRGLALTPTNRQVVTSYLHTAGLLRGLGLLAGFLLPALYAWALGLHLGGVVPWTAAFCGYLIGALYAEISLRRPAGGRAVAAPRLLRAYLLPSLRWGQAVVGVVLVVASAGALLAPAASRSVGRSELPLVATLLVGLVATPTLVVVETWLVRRPQPVLSPDQLAADDAIRSQSIQSIAASGVAVQLSLLTLPLWTMATSDVQLLRWTMWLPGLLSVPLALYVGLEWGHLRWAVRRTQLSASGKVTAC